MLRSPYEGTARLTVASPACLHENPLERPDSTPELVLRRHEDQEIRRGPLQELTAELLEALADRLLVSHVKREDFVAGHSFDGKGR